MTDERMSPRLHIITPCARPQNLPLITKNLLIEQRPHPFEVRLHIMAQGAIEADPKGYFKVNEGIDLTKDGWIWGPSDDTIHPSALFATLGRLVGTKPTPGAIVFSQHRKGVCPWTGGAWDNGEPGILRARPENMKRCRVDATQVFWNRVWLGDRRYDFQRYGPEADGALISELYQKHPDKFLLHDEVLTSFGALDP